MRGVLVVKSAISLVVCIGVASRFFHDSADVANEMMELNANYKQLRTLRPGTILPHRQVDRSDHQWSVFVGFFPALLLGAVPLWLYLGRLGERYSIASDLSTVQTHDPPTRVDGDGRAIATAGQGSAVAGACRSGHEDAGAGDDDGAAVSVVITDTATSTARDVRAAYLCVASLVFVFLAFGIPGLYPVLWVLLNHALVRSFAGPSGSGWFPLLAWCANIFFLVSSDMTRGYAGYLPAVLPAPLARFAVGLFDYYGIMRWQVYSRFVSLRCVSFCVDAHWAKLEAAGLVADEKIEERRRFLVGRPVYQRLQETPRPLGEYGLREFLAYVFYTPLFLAGPIVSFNAFAGQLDGSRRALTLTRRKAFLGMLRLAVYVVALEIYLHYNYSNAIVMDGQFEFLSGWECWCAQYGILKFWWLKFLVIWRFFRLWASLDGIEAPCNMERCMSNHRTFVGFWRGWHASFNIFNIRYLFIPLGGRKRQVVLVWVIFLFVALWHDLSMRWLAWGVYTAAFFSFEVVVVRFFGKRIQSVPGHSLIVAWLSTFSIAALMFSNVAIMLGFEQTIEFTRVMYFNGWSNGLYAFGMTSLYYTAAATLMMTTRELESIPDVQVQKKRT